MSDSAGRPSGPNRLAGESSPYLLQHADNPVDWYPWGKEAFERARAEERPILLSVGYSSCHWCHVMAHESFENEEIAALMNQWFVNVKVDREERPDVDSVYMTATQAMTGQGGWPMTVFLTPDDHQPFFAGTYFPPEDGHGRPGFRRVLESLHEAWETDRQRVVESAEHVASRLQESTAREGRGLGHVGADLAMRAVARYRGAYDAEWGGFGNAPKFPSPGNLDFLLMYHARSERDRPEDASTPGALEMALATLHQMAAGGMYDHLGGGFARYSVDRQWLVPHFEKMLYDNAQLVRAYLHAFQVTGDPGFEQVVRETLTYLEREMLDADGGLYSAQDADSEGIEGKYFVWTPGEVVEVLGEAAGALFNAAYGVTEGGNFEDPHHPEFGRRTVLNRHSPAAEVADEAGLTVEELEARLAELRPRLLAAREERVHPGLDDKVLTSWNGLALAAFAEAGRVLGESHYVELARRNADFVRRAMWHLEGDAGRLLHTYKDGLAKVDGMLEDYAYYGLGLLELYRATGEIDDLRWAEELLDVALERFRDAEHGSFFETAEDGEPLLLRQKPFFDSASPSGNGSTALLAFWIGRYFGRPELERVALEVVGQVEDQLMQAVTGFGTIWQLIELLIAAPRELAIVGKPDARAPLEREVARRFLPTTVLAPSNGAFGDTAPLPLLEARHAADGEVAAYVCENMVCALPARSVEELAAQLDA